MRPAASRRQASVPQQPFEYPPLDRRRNRIAAAPRARQVDGDVQPTLPSSSIRMRSASATASDTSCVTTTAVKPLSCQTRSTRSCISMRVSASSAPSGSSSSSNRGWLTSARARATRCFWPPDSTDGQACSRPSSRPAPGVVRLFPALSPVARMSQADVDIAATRCHGSSRGSWNISRTMSRQPLACRSTAMLPWWAGPVRRAGEAGSICRSRCGRRWRRTVPARCEVDAAQHTVLAERLGHAAQSHACADHADARHGVGHGRER